MKKLLCLALALVLTLAVVGCSDFQSTVKDFDGEISSNGGFAVQKGDYVYFINGSEDETADNTFGKVVKGAIVRVKAADLGKDNAETEIVVPKLVHTEYTGSGSGIFIGTDNYVYYPTINDKKNSRGEVKYDQAVFMRTKLDGTDSSDILVIDGHDNPYRFYEKNGKVYLTVFETVTEDDASVKYLITYDGATGKEVARSKSVSGYDLGEFGCDYAYYTHTAYNETLKQDESFNEVYRYNYDGSSANDNGKKGDLILNGVGGYSDKTYGIGTQGVTFAIVKNAASALFVSMTYVDTSVASSTVYYAIDHAACNLAGTSAAAKANFDAMTLINDGDSVASSVFVSNAIYVSKNCIVYDDSNYGLVKYDYNERNTLSEGLSYIFDDKDIKNYTLIYREGSLLYYASGVYYYRVDLSELVDMTTGATKQNATAKIQRLTYTATFTSGEWLQPEVFGDYMLYSRSTEPYYGYVYCIGFNDILTEYGKQSIDDITDDQIDEYVEKLEKDDEKASVEKALAKMVGKYSSADKDSLDAYYSTKFPE